MGDLKRYIFEPMKRKIFIRFFTTRIPGSLLFVKNRMGQIVHFLRCFAFADNSYYVIWLASCVAPVVYFSAQPGRSGTVRKEINKKNIERKTPEANPNPFVYGFEENQERSFDLAFAQWAALIGWCLAIFFGGTLLSLYLRTIR